MAVEDKNYPWLLPYRRKLPLQLQTDIERGNAISVDTNGDVGELHTDDASFAGFAATDASRGEHDAATSSTVMTDSSKSFATNAFIGLTITNDTDGGSSGVITANTGTTVTVAALLGGDNQNFESLDKYTIRGDAELFIEGIVELTITGLDDDDDVDDIVYASGPNAFTMTSNSNLPIGRVIEVRRALSTRGYVHFQALCMTDHT